MPYKYVVNRISLDMTQRRVIGYRRTLFWQDWWQFVDIDDGAARPRRRPEPMTRAMIDRRRFALASAGLIAAAQRRLGSADNSDTPVEANVLRVLFESPPRPASIRRR